MVPLPTGAPLPEVLSPRDPWVAPLGGGGGGPPQLDCATESRLDRKRMPIKILMSGT